MSTALKPPSGEQVAFVVYLPMKPDQKARGRAMLMEVVTAMSREPDFINTWVHEKQDEPDVVVLYETWACSKDEFISHHLSKPYRTDYEASLAEILSGARQIEFLTPLAAFPVRQV
jgi:quinol monooxygenase YgiN